MATVREAFADVGIDVTPGSADDFAKFLDKEMERYGEVVRKAKISAD